MTHLVSKWFHEEIWSRFEPRAGIKQMACKVESTGDRYPESSKLSTMAEPIFLGKAVDPVYLQPQFINRHGLITGATGTGKTVSLQIIAEALSKQGVPVFMADVKGDLSGMCMAGGDNPKLAERATVIGMTDYPKEAYPVVFWDFFGEKGHRVRTTISEMGPLLLSRLLDLNETQEGVLNIAFRIADEQKLLLLDLKDLRSMLTFIADHSKEIQTQYGQVSSASIGAIQRALLVLEDQGGDQFFGEPGLQLSDLIRTKSDGSGVVNILAADRLMQNPKLYATFLLWLISELFETLPEVGDMDKPKLVFFFDEAHLLFEDAPDALVDKVEQVVRLIRSKGVGIFFITQSPLDVPESVLGQLGNRVQHALRAFTPRDQKAVQTAAETFRQNPAFNTAEVITQLSVGEALVSTLEGKGAPSIVQRTLIRPPSSRLGAATDNERSAVIAASSIGSLYDHPVDRESAYEILTKKAEALRLQEEAEERAEELAKQQEKLAKEQAKLERAQARTTSGGRSRSSSRQSPGEALLKSVLRSAGSQIGRELTRKGGGLLRGVLGGLLKG